MNKPKSTLGKVWYFVWEDDSIWSWLVNIVLAFILIKFIVYPGLGFLLGTSHPIVAVVSSSMEHQGNFDVWWNAKQYWYKNYNISKEDFAAFRFKNGFKRGDIMILKGKEPKDIKRGEVIVFRSQRPDPIIHRVVKGWVIDKSHHFQTKGDNNADSINTGALNETDIAEEEVIGVAMVRVPLLGYVKIIFVELLRFFTG